MPALSHADKIRGRQVNAPEIARLRRASLQAWVDEVNGIYAIERQAQAEGSDLLPEEWHTLHRREHVQPSEQRNSYRYRLACRTTHGDPVGLGCYLCGQLIVSEEGTHADHLTPVSRGGCDEGYNLRWTHGACNLRRSAPTTTYAEFMRLHPNLFNHVSTPQRWSTN
jgi:5-methylcytosine-specific restriction endonuclease McrA